MGRIKVSSLSLFSLSDALVIDRRLPLFGAGVFGAMCRKFAFCIVAADVTNLRLLEGLGLMGAFL